MGEDAIVLLLIVLGMPCVGVLLIAADVLVTVVRLLLLPVRLLVRLYIMLLHHLRGSS